MSEVGTILVVDDEKNIRRTLSMVLESEGYDVVDAEDAEAGLSLLSRRRVDAVLLDVCLPGMDGLTALKAIIEDDPKLPVIMISGHASIQDAVTAVRGGAVDFLEKPLSRERVLLTLKNSLGARRTADELEALKEKAAKTASRLLGEAPAMAKLRGQLAKVAPTKGRVLITGESGTGKELIARALHDLSDRASRPFIKVNCAAIPDALIESTLFGHEKGAFTSAQARRRGHFELAHTGTLFLDEIGDMSLSAQAKVLRVLQTGELLRVGGEQPIQVDVRVVAATNKDLEEACRRGEFREDLFFRLAVVPLESPPLRARREDIPLLVEHFLLQICAENEFRPKRVHPEVLTRLCAHDWPGNVRELRNVVERLAILSDDEILPSDLPSGFERTKAPTTQSPAALGPDVDDLLACDSLREFRDQAERRYIEARLQAHDWNISRTADALGLERTNLHKKMKALGITREH